MADEKKVVLRTEYRYKPDGSDNYVTVYFETSADMVIVEQNENQETSGATVKISNLKEVLKEISASLADAAQNLTNTSKNLQNSINERAYAPVIKTAHDFVSEDPILKAGQFGFESDKKRLKIGDGTSLYSELEYITSSGGTVITDRIAPLVGTSAYFAAVNPLLEEGQLAIITDTNQAKLGDGETRFNELDYVNMSKNSKNVPIIRTAAELATSTVIPKNGQIVVESDTNRYKIGDGVSTYANLEYEETEEVVETLPIISTAADLADTNPLLAKGQIAIETDPEDSTNVKIKIGDGETLYNDLEYFEESTEGTIIVTDSTGITSEDPVLKNGQIVYETDTGQTKIGDGVSKYSDLPYQDTEDTEVTVVVNENTTSFGIDTNGDGISDTELPANETSVNGGGLYLALKPNS